MHNSISFQVISSPDSLIYINISENTQPQLSRIIYKSLHDFLRLLDFKIILLSRISSGAQRQPKSVETEFVTANSQIPCQTLFSLDRRK
tara:strand:+ start:2297 stop:2563 length:267 start_codon:yes stop_codon:yes gene_type:complete